jgi:hypothetical protein
MAIIACGCRLVAPCCHSQRQRGATVLTDVGSGWHGSGRVRPHRRAAQPNSRRSLRRDLR